MVTIKDVSPTRSTMSLEPKWRDVSGRMLSLASSDDGKLVFAGSLSSGLWVSQNGGESWEQVAWEQPAQDQFGVPGALGGCCIPSVAVGPESARWFVDRNPRFMANLTGDGATDIVGFGDTGVWTAISNGDGTFQAPRIVLADFCIQAGGWDVKKHLRFLADVTGTGKADIVGFGDAGVYVALGNGDGTFQPPLLVLQDFGIEAGGWRVEKHPRFLADVDGQNGADIVAFGDDGVFVALSNGDGTFQPPQLVLADFGFEAGGWRVEKHPRVLADITGSGKADIVAFGDDGVFVALSNGNGTFQPPQLVLADFGFEAGGWRVEKHPRFLADVDGQNGADIVAFGNAGVFVALSNGDGTFQAPQFVLADLGFEAGGWRVEKHPRFLADVDGQNGADIVAFGNDGVFVALSNGDGTFQAPRFVLGDFGYEAGGWRVEEHPRFMADVTGEGRADIVGFGNAGVYVATANRDGLFQHPRLVLSNFGHSLTVLAMARSDREFEDAGIWRSTDGGGTWSLVYPFDRPSGKLPASGQLVWALGTAHLVFAADGNNLAVSRNGGATWQKLVAVPATHVAVAATPAGTLNPPAVYALAANMIQVSLDGGTSWIQDRGPLPRPIGGSVNLSNGNNECVMVVSPRSPLEVFVTRDANSLPDLPQLWRGDYGAFAQAMASTWQELPIPNVGDKQDSGNVWLAITRPGQGEALFYGPQRYFGTNFGEAWVGPLDPASASDWHLLDSSDQVHVDLHGLFLSPDFRAGFLDGIYLASGTVWLLSDGGIDRSTDGGNTFNPAGSITSLSTVNFAGLSILERGPLLSLNTGDNDGFVSRDGGVSWGPQQYGGGDNDTSWADPLRPQSMLILTPRWDTNGNTPNEGWRGQTVTLYEAEVGALPDISSSSHRQIIPGPPVLQGSKTWNASSGFAILGSRPLIRNLPSDDPSLPTDCLVIRFFGNYFREDPRTQFFDHLAVLLRARDLRKVKKRTDWNTPGGWSVGRHPRMLAKLTVGGKADIVGFGEAGVWTALSTANGLFADPRFVLADFGAGAGWDVEKHPRFLADVTGTGKADIVGFGDAGVYVALGNGDGTFQPPLLVLQDFGIEAGGWRVEKHPRFLADVDGQNGADIVAFGDDGVFVALSNGDGTFQPPQLVLADFGFEAGGWRVEKHPRVLADITGSGKADIVAFGDDGVFVALSNGNGTFQPPQLVLADFGFEAGGWRVEKHPRFLADVDGTNGADIVGFGNAGVFVALSNGDGTFQAPQLALEDFGDSHDWRVENHLRLLADVDGQNGADIVAFGNDGVFVALSNGDGTFQAPQLVLEDFGYNHDWRVEHHLRLLADVTGEGRADIVGFGDAGVIVSPTLPNGTYRERPLFVIPNFGYQESGPVEQVGPFLPAASVCVVQASGGHDNAVFYVGDTAYRLWKWTEGMVGWQMLIPGQGASQAKRFFVNPYDPNLLYAIDGARIVRSADGGVSWQVDENLQRMVTSDSRIPANRDEAGDTKQVVLSDMQFDPFDPLRRFAVGTAGAFMTTDGVAWQRLLDTGAMRGLPTNCYFDGVSNPSNPSVYVGFNGRGIVKISDLGLDGGEILRALTPAGETAPARPERPTTRIRTADGRLGIAEAAPDGRVFIIFDDGRTILADASDVTVVDDEP